MVNDGTISGSDNLNGDRFKIFGELTNNGTVSTASIESGATEIIGSGGTMVSGIVDSGGQISVSFGGTVQDMEVTSDGTILSDSIGGTFIGTIRNAGLISGGVLSRSGTVEIVSSGGTVGDQWIQNQAVMNLAADATLLDMIFVDAKGMVEINGNINGSGMIDLVGNGGAKVKINGLVMPKTTIMGFTTLDEIDFTSIDYAAIAEVQTSSTGITIRMKDGKTYSLAIKDADRAGYTILDDGRGGTRYLTCFARGTLIRTPKGEIPVECLEVGQRVCTPDRDQPIKWIGHQTVNVAAMENPDEGWLVRIKAGALGEGLPKRDLLITQEHCLFFENQRIPVRMLVNGKSISLDKSINIYTYYHVELHDHEGIFAEDVLTESYLNTGNRCQFANFMPYTDEAADVARNMKISSQHVNTTRNFVEPLFWEIARRAGIDSLPSIPVTMDPGLHLQTPAGTIIRPKSEKDGLYKFLLPAGLSHVFIRSRTAQPSRIIGPFIDDRRHLGVLVGDIAFHSATSAQTLTPSLEEADLPGWSQCETTACRWTMGRGMLRLPSDLQHGPAVLTLKILAAGPYEEDARFGYDFEAQTQMGSPSFDNGFIRQGKAG